MGVNNLPKVVQLDSEAAGNRTRNQGSNPAISYGLFRKYP